MSGLDSEENFRSMIDEAWRQENLRRQQWDEESRAKVEKWRAVVDEARRRERVLRLRWFAFEVVSGVVLMLGFSMWCG